MRELKNNEVMRNGVAKEKNNKVVVLGDVDIYGNIVIAIEDELICLASHSNNPNVITKLETEEDYIKELRQDSNDSDKCIYNRKIIKKCADDGLNVLSWEDVDNIRFGTEIPKV